MAGCKKRLFRASGAQGSEDRCAPVLEIHFFRRALN